MTEFVVDAHAVIWHLEGNSKLGANGKRVLDAPLSKLLLPATALAEACWVVAKGRTSIPSANALLQSMAADRRIIFLPLTREVIQKSMSLPVGMEMHDRQIVATALLLIEKGHVIEIITKDDLIVKAGLLPIVW